MAFVRDNLQKIAGGGSNAPGLFSYLSTDTKLLTLGSGYFNTATNVFNQGDFIIARCSDGAQLMSISSASDAATVTTVVIALA